MDVHAAATYLQGMQTAWCVDLFPFPAPDPVPDMLRFRGEICSLQRTCRNTTWVGAFISAMIINLRER